MKRNLQDHLLWMRNAKERSARLVLFPELSLSGYSTSPLRRETAMHLDSEYHIEIARSARKLDIYVCYDFAWKRGKRFFISQMMVGPYGMVGHYEKVHIAWLERGEGEVFSVGDEFRVFDVDGIKTDINICMDGRSPVSSACLYLSVRY